jgi:hypothetical protein
MFNNRTWSMLNGQINSHHELRTPGRMKMGIGHPFWCVRYALSVQPFSCQRRCANGHENGAADAPEAMPQALRLLFSTRGYALSVAMPQALRDATR